MKERLTKEQVEKIFAESNERSKAIRKGRSIPAARRRGEDGVYWIEKFDAKGER